MNLMMNQLRLEQSYSQEMKVLYRERRLAAIKNDKDYLLKKMIRKNNKLERLLSETKKEAKKKAKEEAKKTENKKSVKEEKKIKQRQASDIRLYKKEEMKELKQLPKENAVRQRPSVPRSVKQEESDMEEDDTDKDKDKKNGEEEEVKRSKCKEELEAEFTDLTRSKFNEDNPNCSD